MDVWFDSGSSWAGVVQECAGRDLGMSFPADLYLEGSNQRGGWFQSSLLTSVAVNGGLAPYKAVLTHRFVLDEKGFEMSKILGNVVDPLLVIEGGNKKKLEPAYGAGVLRLWMARVDYAGDVRVGAVLQEAAQHGTVSCREPGRLRSRGERRPVRRPALHGQVDVRSRVRSRVRSGVRSWSKVAQQCFDNIGVFGWNPA